MAIISKTTEIPSKIKDFPKLMKRKIDENYNYNLVVLFTKEDVGTVVSSNNDLYNIGYHCPSWAMEVFEDYDGEVVLKNA